MSTLTSRRESAGEHSAERPSSWHTLAPWLAGALWLAGVGLGVAGTGVGMSAEAPGRISSSSGPVGFVATALLTVAFASVGLLLAVRRPGNPVGWLFGVVGFVIGFSNLIWGLTIRALGQTPPDVESGRFFAWLSLASIPAWALSFCLLFLLFPDGRPPSRRWALVGWLTVGAAVLALIGFAFSPGGLPLFPQFRNPFRVTGTAGQLAIAARTVGQILVLSGAAAAVASMYARYRRARSIERHQLRWIAYSGGIFVVVGIAFSFFGAQLNTPTTPGGDLPYVLVCVAGSLVPISAAIAILRYRLYDIDRLIGRTFVYGALTAILAGLYAASIRLFNSLFVGLTGQGSDAALVLTTLVLATSFTPLKHRLEGIVERRFRDEDQPAPAVPEAPHTRAELEEVVRRIVREEAAAPRSRRSSGRSSG